MSDAVLPWLTEHRQTLLGVASAGVITSAAVYGLYRRYNTEHRADMKVSPQPFDFSNQTRTIAGEEGVRVSNTWPHDEIMDTYPEMPTLYDAFRLGWSKAADKNCLGWRPAPDQPFKWITYNEVYEQAKELGSGLSQLGLKRQEFVGIYSSNRIEWSISQLSCNCYSFIVSPLYDTLGYEACLYIIRQTEMKLIICDNGAKVKRIIDLADQLPSLKYLIVIDMSTVTQDQLDQLTDADITVLEYDAVREKGHITPVPVQLPTADDLASVLYTSGTTGDPKGVMLSHGNYAACLSGILEIFKPINLNQDDVIISYLPLAHGFEQTCQGICFSLGASIGFFQGNIKTLMSDIEELKPTIIPMVPRLMNRLYDKVMTGVKQRNCFVRWLFNYALQSKLSLMTDKGIVTRSTIWDRIFFRKIQNILGGRCRFMLTGAAPLSGDVMSFIRCVTGAQVAEGYGQTEIVSASNITVPWESTCGHVGVPIPTVSVKIVDVPEMEYYTKENRGEVCYKGPATMKGYYKQPEKTAETIDKNGWVHSGDIGQWLPTGQLQIIDRRKNLFKLAQGEYIAPEKIENIYLQSPFIGQVFIHGDSLQSFVVGIVVPDFEYVDIWAKKTKSFAETDGTYESLCRNGLLKDAIMKDIIALGKSNKFTSLEQVKDIYICVTAFSVEDDLLTPTLKLKRNQLRKRFSNEIQQIYERLV